MDLSKLKWQFYGDRRCEIIFTGEPSLTGAEEADACRLHSRRADGTWAKTFSWESSTDFFISRDRSRRQQRTDWATKTLGRILDSMGIHNEPIRSEGIIDISKSSAILVDCQLSSAPPKLKWKGKLAADLGLDIGASELEFSTKTARRSRRTEDPADPWG